jgi:hypothetical protein
LFLLSQKTVCSGYSWSSDNGTPAALEFRDLLCFREFYLYLVRVRNWIPTVYGDISIQLTACRTELVPCIEQFVILSLGPRLKLAKQTPQSEEF